MNEKRRCKALFTARLVFKDRSVVDIVKGTYCWLTNEQIKEHNQFVILDEVKITETPIEKKVVVEEPKCEKCHEKLINCVCNEQVDGE